MSGFEDFDDEDYAYYMEIQKKHKEIKKLRKEGKSIPDIAKIVGYSLETVKVIVNNQAKAREVYIKNRRIIPKGINKILELRKEGRNLREISEIIGCSVSSVSRILKKQK